MSLNQQLQPDLPGSPAVANCALFDSHCHLNLPELWPDWQLHWQQAKALGVQKLLVPAVQRGCWRPLLALRQQHPDFDIALGIHPWWATQHQLVDLTELEQLFIDHAPLISAVGEIGLDYALDPAGFACQQQLFSAQLALARQFDKPVVLHHRKSMVQLLAELKRQKFQQGGILHAFSGSPEQGAAFLAVGFKLGIGGTITYSRAEKTRAAIRRLPLQSFVLETDAPAMPLAGWQGTINTPARLALVFAEFCRLRPESPMHVAQQLWRNTCEALQLSCGYPQRAKVYTQTT